MLNLIFEIPTLLTGSYLVYLSIKCLLKGRYSFLHIGLVIFYIMQIVPIFVGYFGDTKRIEQYYKYMYLAMNDELVRIIYALFCLCTVVVLWYSAQKYARLYCTSQKINIKKSNNSKIVSLLCILLMQLPIVGVLFSPKPSAYLHFAYFTMNRSTQTLEAIYHTGILSNILMLAFGATILFYYINPQCKSVALMSTALITWINGKRTLMLFLLLAILVIDFLNWDKENKRYLRKMMREAIAFGAIILFYYLFYKQYTGKSDFADGFLLYSTYFSRLSTVKVAIYDCLYTNNMIAYPFETLIFDLLFFVPRALWQAKPRPFFMRFSYYTLYGSGLNISSSNYIGWAFQVNCWTEFIANAGIIGWLLNIFFIKKIIRITEKSNELIITLTGSAFIFLYMMYGFEHIVQILFVVFLICVAVDFIKKHIRIKG